jgi:hypothetical protein
LKSKGEPSEPNDIVLKILAEIEETARKEFLPSIGPIKGKIIEDVIKQYKPKMGNMIMRILIVKVVQLNLFLSALKRIRNLQT